MAIFSKRVEEQTEETSLSPDPIQLGSDIEFRGTLNFQEKLCINGRFEGELYSENGTLVVGKDAEIRANIQVGSLISKGKIYGNISASDRIELSTPAQVFGDIQASRLEMEEGVILVGNVNVNPGNINPAEPSRKTNIHTDEDLLQNQIEF